MPKKFDVEISHLDRLRMIRRGNQPSVDKNPSVLPGLMNDEDRHSHVVALRPFVLRFSPFLSHAPQSLSEKNDSFHLIWDGTTKLHADDMVINELTPTDGEPPVTFGSTRVKFNSRND